MRALLLDPPEEFLAERRRKGADRWDEVWDGVLHMVPPPSGWHQQFGTDLVLVLAPVVKALGMKVSQEMGVFRPGTGERDYRLPDVVVYRMEHFSDRGVEGKAEFVAEVLSPGDESREKFGFYAACGIAEVLIVDPRTREFDLHVLRGEKYFILKDERGAARSSVLGVTFSRVDGPKLRVSTSSGTAEI